MSVIKINKDIKNKSRNDWRDPFYLNDILIEKGEKREEAIRPDKKAPKEIKNRRNGIVLDL